MRQFQGGVLFLIITIVYTLTLVLSLCQSFNGALSVISTLISLAPQILICIGLWMLFAAAKGAPSTTGYTLASVGLIIRLVLAILSGVVGIIGVVIFSAATGLTDVDGGGLLMVMILMAIAVGVCLNAFYYIGLYQVAKSSKAVTQGTGRELKVPLYPIILMIVIALFQVVWFIFTLAGQQIINAILNQMIWSMGYMLDSSSYSAIYQVLHMLGLSTSGLVTMSKLVNIASVILCLVGLIQYRKLNQWAYSYPQNPQPVYPQGGGNPQGGYAGGFQQPQQNQNQNNFGGGFDQSQNSFSGFDQNQGGFGGFGQ
jgi:hypothetical protein